jgi:uncharacterized protein (DUF1330 family)
MPAYMIVANKVIKPEIFWPEYAAKSIPLVLAYGGKYRLLGNGADLLEGDEEMEGAAALVLEFPDIESIRKFWNSPEYAEIKKAREGGVSKIMAFATDAPWLGEDGNDIVLKMVSESIG